MTESANSWFTTPVKNHEDPTKSKLMTASSILLTNIYNHLAELIGMPDCTYKVDLGQIAQQVDELRQMHL